MAQGAGGDGARVWADAVNQTGAAGAVGDPAAHRRADGAEPAGCAAESPRGNRQAREGVQTRGSYGSLEPSLERAKELAHRESLIFCRVAARHPRACVCACMHACVYECVCVGACLRGACARG